MPDSRIYDAINLFKYSDVGRGEGDIGGDASYRRRYRELAARVLQTLWTLWSADEIGFEDLGPRTIGNSQTWRVGYDIKVNTRIEPAADPALYATPAEQGKLAMASANLVHEAVHLAHDYSSYPEEEVLCRTIQMYYIRELMRPRSYHSRVAGASCTAQLLPTTPFYQSYRNRLNRLLSRDLIDNVLSIPEYHRDLESSATSDFFARSLDWWNGLDNRWPSTRGYYLRSLSSQNRDYAPQILRILESLDVAQWPAARSCAGDMGRIRAGLRRGHHIYNNVFGRRIQDVQRRLGADLGMQARP